MECYICTEETSEKSPCKCQAIVHEECLKKFIEESKKAECSICRQPLDQYSDLEIQTQNRNVFEKVRKFVTFLMCGYIGRSILALAISPHDPTDYYFWLPIEIDFFLLAAIVYMGCFSILKAITYLSCCYINNYDSFDDTGIDDYDGESV